MTLFPGSMSSVLGESIIGRAAKKGAVEINCVQIRDYTENKQMQVDDYPYGGGWGLVMMAQPLKSCLDDIMSKAGPRRSRRRRRGRSDAGGSAGTRARCRREHRSGTGCRTWRARCAS